MQEYVNFSFYKLGSTFAQASIHLLSVVIALGAGADIRFKNGRNVDFVLIEEDRLLFWDVIGVIFGESCCLRRGWHYTWIMNASYL